MDRPPADHGSDRYDYIEVEAPAGVEPSGPWWELLRATPCPDCRANIFAKWVGGPHSTPGDRDAWFITFAHDDTCPALAKRETGEHD